MISDDEVLQVARRLIPLRGYADGFLCRDAWLHEHTRRPRDVPPTISWTAALKRLERSGELRRIPLVGSRGGPAGFGFELP